MDDKSSAKTDNSGFEVNNDCATEIDDLYGWSKHASPPFGIWCFT